MEWLKANIGGIVVGLVLVAIVTLVVVKMVKDKRKGKSSCGCGCGCSACALCHKCNSLPDKKNVAEKK